MINALKNNIEIRHSSQQKQRILEPIDAAAAPKGVE